ncbi:RPM1 interacting protein 13 isoform X4 [Populus alba]|uniref:RPM1 interacting protein 13 n=1 Tax=Populus alba TaxID=43335 RepID=A0A4U5QP37_POPAL|nr:uncharacterized protein LOC118050024 isoform X4 [Populus alba]TKS12151.1 uncharacterized protein D5086_0000067370 [Populus alba]
MDSNSVVFDISSDEEPAIEEPKEFDDDCNWLTELLRTVDKEKDDSDEVVIVGEYNPPKPKSKSKSSNQVADIKFVLDGDDDDCVVLGGDPDKPVSAADDVCRNETDSSDDGDDVLVVAEKGQVACRDYPHPRHLCVEFPFGSTPHERHCNLCHCYVCDSLAPCVHWGTGVSTIDHCHATDKQETWKNQRKICRTGKDVPIPVSKLHDITVPMALPLLNHVASLDIVPHNQSLTHNPMLQNQVSRIHPIRSCSSSTIPNIIRRHRRRQPGCVLGGNKHLSRSVSQQALGVRTDVQRDRHPNALGYARNVAPLATSKESPSSMHYGLPNANFESHTYQSSPQPNMGSVIVNTMPSRSEVGSQPTLQSNDGQSLYQLGNQVSNNEPSTVKLLNSQFAEIESAQFHYNDHELVDSFFLNQAVPVVSDGFVPHDLNGFSPERPAIDTDTGAVKKGPICAGLGQVSVCREPEMVFYFHNLLLVTNGRHV